MYNFWDLDSDKDITISCDDASLPTMPPFQKKQEPSIKFGRKINPLLLPLISFLEIG